MRRTIAFVLIAGTTAGSSVLAQGNSAPAPALSLAAAVNEALVKNERLVNQSDAIAQADLGLRLARNTFRPKVTPNIFGSLGRDDISSQTYRVDVSQKLVTGTELRASVGTVSQIIPGDTSADSDVLFYNADTTLTVSQPLLRGFGRSVTRRGLTAAELRREDAARRSRYPNSKVAVDVAAAYYRVVSQQAFVDVARQSLVRAPAAARCVRSEARCRPRVAARASALATARLAGGDAAVRRAIGGRRCARSADVSDGPRQTEPFTVEASRAAAGLDPIDVTSATAIALANRLDLKSRIAASEDAENQIRFSQEPAVAAGRRELRVDPPREPRPASATAFGLTASSLRRSSRSRCRSIARRSRSNTSRR
jgi:outer membrane protein TolC